VGLLKPLPVARGCWERVGVDFITDVTTSFRGNNCIVTFVDHFSKRVTWMPCTKTIDAAEFAQLFLEAIIQLHGVPREIVSNRDTCFTSDFWAEVSKRLQTKLLMSMVFHPQTDGLSEISNKQVTRYLQAFTTHHQDQRDTMLPPAEYAYNTSMHSCTDRSPFELD
jgi:transposase InsO family protein